MNKSTASASTDGLLQIALIVLKLCKVIDWSWWIVLIPTWVSIIFFFVAILVIRWFKR